MNAFANIVCLFLYLQPKSLMENTEHSMFYAFLLPNLNINILSM